MIVGAPDPPAWPAESDVTPGAEDVMARASGENFPVAMRVLSRAQRRHLLALYGFARLVDELGDEAGGDRLAALEWLEAELDRAYGGRASHSLMRRLTPTLTDCRLPREPFVRLIDANRLDQRRRRYDTWEQLQEYCTLSANPVGELVLCVFGQAGGERAALSDSVCTALQLIEHCQDVGEDYARGRVYLPQEDLERFGCHSEELGASRASPALRRVLAFELARAGALLDRGSPLVGLLHGRARLAVAGFLGGGRAALAAMAGGDYEVLGAAPRPSRSRTALAIARSLTAIHR